MHRHTYHGRKLSRQRDQRRALLKSLATSLVMQEAITTTKPKAKEVVRYFEPLVTKAKAGSLHGRRQVAAAISTEAAIDKLYKELVPNLQERNSGYLSLKPAGYRLGDHAELTQVRIIKDKPAAKSAAEKTTAPAKSQAKKPAASATKEAK
jgi:large subunit ribosomal protein L17